MFYVMYPPPRGNLALLWEKHLQGFRREVCAAGPHRGHCLSPAYRGEFARMGAKRAREQSRKRSMFSNRWQGGHPWRRAHVDPELYCSIWRPRKEAADWISFHSISPMRCLESFCSRITLPITSPSHRMGAMAWE